MVSFLTNEGQTDLYGSQLAARQCYQIAREAVANQEMHLPLNLALRATNSNYWVRWTRIPRRNPEHTNILRSNHDIFAWTHSDMKGIHPSIASHKLNVFPAARPIRQKIRRFHPDRQRVIQDEINKLLEAGFIREFSLTAIDQIVDSTSGQGMLSFLDAFSGYHQIPMSPDDEEKTAFITPHGLYCYKVMPFGLKNAGATYQRLMTKIFKPLIGRSVEVYIDDIVVKSKTREQHILHLQEVFYLLRKYDMKLNPSKCAFGVSAGKFLGFMVSQRGIEVSPDQVKAVMETPPPRNKKELQRLTGKLVALGRFIARFTDELRPFFLAIRKAGTQGWTDNCQNALERIKHCLMHPPILSSPIPKEKLYMYLAVSEWAISAVLFRCPSPKEQKPVYYVSRALADVETSPFVAFYTTRFNWANATWAIELSEFGIEFQPRLSKKGQVMADFVLEYSRRPDQHHESSEQEWWTLRVDGASRSSGSGVGLLLQSPTGEHLEQPSGWDSPRLTMKQNTRPSCPDWTSPCAIRLQTPIYSDSQLVRADNGRADALAGIAASLPIREAILLPIHVQANPSVAENSTCNSIEQTKRMIKNGRMILQNISGQELYPKILNKRTKSGPWPFAQWGMDIVGPLPAAPAQKKFLLVATDYFSKWVEAEAYASIKDKDVTNSYGRTLFAALDSPNHHS
ncbi:Retrovirus-related Pol polyprotein from transposon 17.6 [Vitis vinifera]|uniref:Retrovirus-related Pol polyprotein from transposon 17.6 n=1 Tax=Vitis vinifera TaxID=29760 RepID=A0A438EGB4_VITVI|nr:Retrovirus-related Pol polyprotein from transposon 17.6 [Vitis vinifera]